MEARVRWCTGLVALLLVTSCGADPGPDRDAAKPSLRPGTSPDIHALPAGSTKHTLAELAKDPCAVADDADMTEMLGIDVSGQLLSGTESMCGWNRDSGRATDWFGQLRLVASLEGNVAPAGERSVFEPFSGTCILTVAATHGRALRVELKANTFEVDTCAVVDQVVTALLPRVDMTS